MQIHHYHPETADYLGPGVADESPREPGVFLLPAYTTALAPPAEHPEFRRVFRNGAWGYVPKETGGGEEPTPQPVITASMVDAERDRRIIDGFTFGGILFQSRPEDRENIAGAKSLASDAIILGAEAGDLSWRKLLDEDGPEVFVWIAADNSLVPMDAHTVVRFAYAAVSHKERMIFAARAVKSMDPIPLDYAENAAYWPQNQPYVEKEPADGEG